MTDLQRSAALTPSASYLLARFDGVRERVRACVADRQAVDPDPDDRFRGLYVSDEQAVQLLDDPVGLPSTLPEVEPDLESWGDEVEGGGNRLALRTIARSFGLDELDVAILLVALGPDLDQRLERAYGYLHDDVTRRRASIGLALELCGRAVVDPDARARCTSASALIDGGLIVVEEEDRPFLTRSLRVPDVVAAHLLGAQMIDPVVAPFVTSAVAGVGAFSGELRRAISHGVRLVHVRDRVGAAAWSYAATVAAGMERALLPVDLSMLASEDDALGIVRAAVRQARLDDAVLALGPIDVLAERFSAAIRAGTDGGALVIMIGSMTWDPLWSARPPLLVDAPDIVETFHEALPFRLTPEQSARALAAAEQQAVAAGEEVTVEHLAIGARSQNAGGLERRALRVAPVAGWDDVVLPDDVRTQLHEISDRVHHRREVFDNWGLRRSAAKGRGVTALFSGDSGTGKTLAAEVLANDLHMDLYVIDLATVVDKYIGETEKHLDRIFSEADRVNGVLLFDEADAIFGKRSEVQDARDRYANVEVAYLLQRMERFDGIAILTTNLRANIDEAFLRRLDALVDFPNPDEELRRELWERHLPSGIPRADDVDLAFLAARFELSGGNIRNIAMSGAFLSAAAGTVLTMESLVRATAREYRKLGRLLVTAEFGEYHSLISN